MLLSELDEAKVPLELVRAMLREILLAIVTLRVDVVAEAGCIANPLARKAPAIPTASQTASFFID